MVKKQRNSGQNILAQACHLNRNGKAFLRQREMSAQGDTPRLIEMALHAWG